MNSINQKGFTLIELLSVLVILVVLSAIMIPQINNIIIEQNKAAYLIQVKELVRICELDAKKRDYMLPREYDFKDGKLEYKSDEIQFENKIEGNGYIKFDEEGHITVKIENEDFTVNKENKKEYVIESK